MKTRALSIATVMKIKL